MTLELAEGVVVLETSVPAFSSCCLVMYSMVRLSKMGVRTGGQDLEGTVVEGQEGGHESFSAEIVGHEVTIVGAAGVLFVEIVSVGGSGELIADWGGC